MNNIFACLPNKEELEKMTEDFNNTILYAQSRGWINNIGESSSHPRYVLTKEGIGFFIAHMLNLQVFVEQLIVQRLDEDEGEKK